MARKNKNSPNLKWSIIWIIFHSISLFLMGLLNNYLSLEKGLVPLFITGFGVTIIASILRIFTGKKKFIVDKWFLFWSIINTGTIWSFTKLFIIIKIEDALIILLLTAFALVLIAYLIRRFKMSSKILWIIIVIIVLVLVLMNYSNHDNLVFSTIQQGNLASGKIFDSIKLANPFAELSNCPQLDVPMSKWGDLNAYKVDRQKYDGWSIGAYGGPFLYCNKGNEKGENPNYWYCGELDIYYGERVDYGLMTKTEINSDGTIGDTTRKSFSNIYDEKMNFVKTVCGKDPAILSKQKFDKAMNDLDKIFG